jgi:hypothetical protein
MGAMMGGVSTAALLLGPLGFFKIVAAASRAASRNNGTVPVTGSEALIASK